MLVFIENKPAASVLELVSVSNKCTFAWAIGLLSRALSTTPVRAMIEVIEEYTTPHSRALRRRLAASCSS